MNYLLIWDIDGTLINLIGIGRKALNAAFYEIYGIKDAFDNAQMIGALDLPLLRNAFKLYDVTESFVPMGNSSDNLLSKEAINFFDTYSQILLSYVSEINTSLAAPGVLELLNKLKEYKNIYNSLGTGNTEKGARIKLSVDNMNDFFPTGGFGDEAIDRCQLIEKAIEKSSKIYGVTFEKENIYVIGDTTRDIEAGKKTGVKTIGVATGTHSTERLLQSGADHVFQDLINVDAFLGTIHSRL